MNKVDTTTWTARSGVGLLLLLAMLVALPQQAAAQKAIDAQGNVYDEQGNILFRIDAETPPVQQAPLQEAHKTAALDGILDEHLSAGLTTAYTSQDGAFSVADDFVLTESKTIGEIEFYNIYFDFIAGGPVPATDDFTVIFHEDAGGLPGATIATQTGVASTRTGTGMIFVGREIFNHVLSIDPVALGPGTYWVEIYDDFPESTFSLWQAPGDADPGVSGPSVAQAGETPGSSWGLEADPNLSLILRGAPEADMAVTKEIEYSEGSLSGSYHITVYNLGPDDVTSVIATDNLPGAIIVNSWSTTQGSFDPFSGIWDIGFMADGAAVSLWIYFTLTEQGRYTNEVWVESELDDPDESNNHAEVSIILLGDRVVPDFVPGQGAGGTISRGDRFTADLTLDKTVDNETPNVGDDVTWTIAVANLGPQSTAKVEVTDTPDGCLAYVSDDPTRGSYDSSTGIWTIGKLKVGEAVSLELVTNVTADCSGEVVNYAEVTKSSLPDPDDQFDIFDQTPEQDEQDSASINVSGRQLELDGTTFALGHNYPNPFNPMTVIPYSVAEVSHVSIKVYDLLGRTVATLVDGTMAAGVHEVSFDASSHPTGMYLVRMEASGIVKTMRVTLMK